MNDDTNQRARINELRELLAAATPGNLSTAERHTPSECVECPMCQGDGEIEAADYCNFDGKALGVQFYGIGNEFGAHERLWSATIKALPMLLDLAERATSAREEALREAADAIARICPNIANLPDLYLNGIEDAKVAVLSLITGGGEREE